MRHNRILSLIIVRYKRIETRKEDLVCLMRQCIDNKAKKLFEKTEAEQKLTINSLHDIESLKALMTE